MALGVQQAPTMQRKMNGLVAAVVASGLCAAGCVLDWSVPSGSGGGSGTSGALQVSCPFNGVCECPAGGTCAMTCAGSTCNIVCHEGASCEVDCSGATCKLECQAGASCLAACHAATCVDLCDADATCLCDADCASQ